MNGLSLLKLIKWIYFDPFESYERRYVRNKEKSIDKLDARVASRGYDVITAGCIKKINTATMHEKYSSLYALHYTTLYIITILCANHITSYLSSDQCGSYS